MRGFNRADAAHLLGPTMSIIEFTNGADVIRNRNALRQKFLNMKPPERPLPPSPPVVIPIRSDLPAEKLCPVAVRLVPSVEIIKEIVAKFYCVSVMALESERRTKELVGPRHIVMHLAREMTPRSYPQIARSLGGKDHTTVMHGDRRITKMMETDGRLRDEILLLKIKIGEAIRPKAVIPPLEWLGA